MSAMSEAVFDADADLERRIKAKGEEIMTLAKAGQSKAASAMCIDMAALVAQRSPEAVLRFEIARGLR
jgi:hypothetical protein